MGRRCGVRWGRLRGACGVQLDDVYVFRVSGSEIWEEVGRCGVRWE